MMRLGSRPSFFVLSVLLVSGVFACTRKTESPKALDPAALLTRGRVIYQTNCTACHNSDPHKPGSVGPELFGSSLELIEARVLRAGYPTGYKPKRETHLMTALPFLKEEIPAVHQYLNSSP